MKSPGYPINGSSAQRWAKLMFIAAVLLTAILIGMGIAGVHWPGWLLALTTVL